MSGSTGQLVECPICGDEFDPQAAGGWCTNPDCGEWRTEDSNVPRSEAPIGEGHAEDEQSAEADAVVDGGVDADNDGNAADGGDVDADDDGNDGDAADGGDVDGGSETGAEGDDTTAAESADAPATGEPATDESVGDESAAAETADQHESADTADQQDTSAETAQHDGPADAGAAASSNGTQAAEQTASESCPSCGAGVAPDDQFCPKCGEELADDEPALDACPACGADVAADDRFCAKCGEDLDEHRSAGDTGAGASGATQDAPDALVLETRGRSIRVSDGETVGRRIRSLITETGGDQEEAVRVHREHIRFVRESGQFYLVNLGENPTRLNGQPLRKGERTPIGPGDQLELSGVVTLDVGRP